jgi:23S rRNA pseudouridine1911/1915/1917 synthase
MSVETTLTSRVSADHAGRSLIDFLRHRFKYHNRAEWESLIKQGKVTVNGSSVRPDEVLKKNDAVSYTTVLREPPVDTAIKILHEEDSFLVAAKPGNLPSHADGNFIKNTFIYILRERLADRGHRGPVKLVHRLDRETSGIIIAAKTDDAHRILVRQFERGSVVKEYFAVVHGLIEGQGFEVGGAIAPDPDSIVSIRKRVVPLGTPGAKSASTRFEVIQRFPAFTLLRCVPFTGRTNQIRIHLSYVGHPLVGDKLYGRTDEEFLSFVRQVRAGNFDRLPWMETSRHLLHAARLGFHHPVTRKPVLFQCEMPADMWGYINHGDDRV